jgi:N4-(beta-N-acetylglucosaminyl)-L-asparaginase
MSNRRNFIRTAAVASVAVALNSLEGSPKGKYSAKKNKTYRAVYLEFGIEANEVAWQILKKRTCFRCC